MKRLIDEPAFAAAAQAVAARHVDDDPAARLAAVADRIEAVIATRHGKQAFSPGSRPQSNDRSG